MLLHAEPWGGGIGRVWDPSSKIPDVNGLSYPKTLRTYILRLLGPKTI